MKLTQKQLLELVKAAGVANAEIVDDEANSDFNMDSALSTIDTSRGAILKPTWEQEAIDKITSDIAGKSGGVLRSALAQTTGIDRNLLKDLKDNEAIKVAMEHYGKTLGASKEDTLKAIADVSEAKDKEWSEKLDPVIKERDEWKGKYTRRNMLEGLAKELSKAPLHPKLDKNVAAEDFEVYLASKYNMQYNEATKTIELFEKDKPNIPAMNGSQRVNILDEAKGYFEPRTLWVTDNRGANAAAATNAAASGQPQQISIPQPAQPGQPPIAYKDQLSAALNQMATNNGVGA